MKVFAYTLVVIGALNFIAFFLGVGWLGGMASAGKIDGGHFYVGNRGHFTEVSQKAFEYIKLHETSVWITLPLAMLGAILLNRMKGTAKTIPALTPR
jgi:hypothetical protein